ncbi:MAG TPA: sialidase family protein [Drouetiella sp.]|jgi:hypothetical protein
MKRAAWMSAALTIGIIAAAFLPDASASAKTKILGTGHTPSIASSTTGRLCVVFEGLNEENGLSDVYCSFSDDEGKTWSGRIHVSQTLAVSTRPRIAFEKSGAIDVVWTDTAYGENNPDIFFSRSTDDGTSWSRPINISHTPGASRDPELAIGTDGKIHVLFVETPAADLATRDIYYTNSTDGGKTWTDEHHLENISNTKSDSSEPTLAISTDGTLHAAWKEENASSIDRPQILYSYRNANGWQPAINVSRSLKYSYHPVIACGADGNVFINWLDRSKIEGAADVWCITLKNYTPVQPPTHITSTGSIASSAEMTADKLNRIAVVWPDRALGTDLPRIRVKAMANGTSELSRSKKFRHNSSVQLAPAVAIDGDNLTIAWEERNLDRNPIKVRSFSLPQLLARKPSKK